MKNFTKNPFILFVPRLFIISVLLFCPPFQRSALSSDEAENIAVYEEVSGSVVNIINTTVRYDTFYRAIPMEDFGAGVIVKSTGLILTSLHLTDGALKLEVELFDGTRLRADIVGIDRSTDIALLQINSNSKLRPVRFAKHGALKVGAKVLAIGNPFGLDSSLTVGIVSSTSRRLRASNGAVIDGLIQTDAATNPGSSGGPLLNSNGEMAGLNAAIFSPVAGSVGVGLAIPVSIIEPSIAEVLKRAEKSAYVPPVWLGLTGQDMDAALGARLKFKTSGILVASVFEGSPAFTAGIKGATGVVNLSIEQGRQLQVATGGDYILEVDGIEVGKMKEFNAHVAVKQPGDTVYVGLLRKGVRVDVEVTLTPRPRIK